MTKNHKNIDIFDIDCSENHEKSQKIEKIQKITKTLTFLNMIAAKIMQKMVVLRRLRLCQNRDLFMPDLPK